MKGEQVSYFVGSQGVNIYKIHTESGAVLDFAPPNDIGAECKLIFKGTVDQVNRAEASAKEYLAEAVNLMEKDCEKLSENVTIDPDMISRMIGARGDNINRIRKLSGAVVELDETPSAGHLNITGSKRAISKAKDMIYECMDQFGKSERRRRSRGRRSRSRSSRRRKIDEWMIIDRELRGAVIGKNGETIKRLEQDSGATLDFDRDMAGTARLRIRGTEEQVRAARGMVDATLANTAEGMAGIVGVKEDGVWRWLPNHRRSPEKKSKKEKKRNNSPSQSNERREASRSRSPRVSKKKSPKEKKRPVSPPPDDSDSTDSEKIDYADI